MEYPLYILCFKLHASDKETEMVITLCIFAPHWLVYECTTLRVTRSEPTACEPVVQRAVLTTCVAVRKKDDGQRKRTCPFVLALTQHALC